MKGVGEVTNHLKILRTWASFAKTRDINFFTSRHFADMADWIDDTIILLREQTEELRQLRFALKEMESEGIVVQNGKNNKNIANHGIMTITFRE